MKIARGDHWLRLTLVTPACFGAAEGTGAIDRPTAKDPQYGLPYLPDSVIKGIIAGGLGDINEARPDRSKHREELFGSPDRKTSWGRPGPLVFGNGDLLAFPLPTGLGSPAWCIPAPTLARLLDAVGEGADRSEGLRLLARLERDGKAVLADPSLALADAPEPLTALAGSEESPGRRQLFAAARAFAEESLRPSATLVIAPGKLAGTLWRSAAEVRTLTALEPAGKTVRQGSLRQVELVPAGTAFISLLTSLRSGLELKMSRALQGGAWEAQGFGWIVPRLIRPKQISAEEEAGGSPRPPAGEGPPPGPEPRTEAMTRMRASIARVEGAPPPVRAAARAAIKNFGPRSQQSGVISALSFVAAKAKPNDPEPGSDTRANRWLLAALLGLGGDPLADRSAYSELAGHLADQGTAVVGDGEEEQIVSRWAWLRRYAELALHPQAAPPQGATG